MESIARDMSWELEMNSIAQIIKSWKNFMRNIWECCTLRNSKGDTCEFISFYLGEKSGILKAQLSFLNEYSVIIYSCSNSHHVISAVVHKADARHNNSFSHHSLTWHCLLTVKVNGDWDCHSA